MRYRNNRPSPLWGIWAIAMLIIMVLCLIRIDTVCMQQVDLLNQHMEHRQLTEVENTSYVDDIPLPDTISLGEYKITHYCGCAKCCGKSDGITATGTRAEAGRTIAVDPGVIPYGTKVIIDGHEYVAEDCGGAIKGAVIDVFCASHEEALQRGVAVKEVFVIGDTN